ncbi:MAG TPA: ABC transporter ATP-binding protein [Casimicrobiaceae bacterium]|nr:ABC transporter ATP-binding protein [Casimicrobiaceae bacterium]
MSRATNAASVPTIVALRGVSKTYENGTRALAAVDLDVRRGEFLTLVGPSGCGKSTLLHLIAGLTHPSSGRMAWWGDDAFEATGGEGRRIALVFQSPTLMPWATLATNVRLPLDLAGVPRAAAHAAVAGALSRVGLSAAADHLPRELSGGMQMRASIARALVTEPDLLLMDEPFGALDEFTRQRLDSELLSLWTAQRFTVVFVTHSIQEAVFLSTRVAVMAAHPGRLVGEARIDEPFPRDDAFRLSPAFAAHAQHLSASVAQAGADALPDSSPK